MKDLADEISRVWQEGQRMPATKRRTRTQPEDAEQDAPTRVAPARSFGDPTQAELVGCLEAIYQAAYGIDPETQERYPFSVLGREIAMSRDLVRRARRA